MTDLSVIEAHRFFEACRLPKKEMHIARLILREIQARLGFLRDVGLDYLTLSRSAGTLSGGEAQRIRLATQLGSSLMGVLYILDEPSIGLHQRDNERLIRTLEHMRDLGNTLIVVEHDEDTMLRGRLHHRHGTGRWCARRGRSSALGRRGKSWRIRSRSRDSTCPAASSSRCRRSGVWGTADS